jgi:hypothetical protein
MMGKDQFPVGVLKDKPMEYKCALCEGVFQTGWSDTEARDELEEKFPGFEVEDCVMVCDDCYKKFQKDASNAR